MADVEWPSFVDIINNTNNNNNNDTNTNHIVKIESDDEETEGVQAQQGHQQTIDEDDSGNKTASVDPNPDNENNIITNASNNASTNTSTSAIVTPVKEEKNDDQEILISNLRKEKHILSQKVTRYQRKSNQYRQQLEDMKNENILLRNEKMKLKQDMREQNEIFATEKSELLREIDQLKKMKLKEVESSDGNSNSSSDMRDSDSADEESSTSDSSSSSSDHSFCDKNKNSSIPKFITTTTTSSTNNNIEHSLALATGKRKQDSCDYNNDVTSSTSMSASSSCRHQNKKRARQETTTHRRSMNSNNMNHLIQSSSSDQNSLDLPDFKSGKYRRFAECKLFHLLHDQGWKFRFRKNTGSTIRPIFFPPSSENERKRTRLQNDVQVKDYLKEHGMMTPELKKAFYEYDQEEDEEISLASVHDESSNNNNNNNNHHLKPSSFSSSRESYEIEGLREIKTGKYKRMADCNIFNLLAKQGWRFKFQKNPTGISYKPFFYPPGETVRKNALTTDDKVREYLIEHQMMTPELERAFDTYDQGEVQKKKNEIYDEEFSQGEKSSTSSLSSSLSSSSHNKNENSLDLPDFKSGKYRHFAACKLFHLLHEQGWTFRFRRNSDGSASRPNFFPPRKTSWNDALTTDDKVKKYLIKHHMMSEELKKAFDKYDQEIQKENNKMESSHNINENRFVPSIDIKTGKYRRFLKTGKYERMADCNIFVLLDKQGWRFKFHKNPKGITYMPVFYPPPNENEKNKPPLTSDVKVKDYLKEHGMMTEELEKAFYEYDQEAQKENNEMESHDKNENRLDLPDFKSGKYRHFDVCKLFHLLHEQGWTFRFHKRDSGISFKPIFFPPGTSLFKDALTTDDKVKKYLIKRDMMTPELKKAFDKYDQEVQKENNNVHSETDEEISLASVHDESSNNNHIHNHLKPSSFSHHENNEMESSHNINENRFVPSNIKTGKYTHFEKCNLFVLLDEQGWTFKHYVSSNSFHFYPPGKTQYEDAVTCDIKVREYLNKRDMMTPELKKAFDMYEQEVQKEKNSIDSEIDYDEEESSLASVHDETSILQSSENISSSLSYDGPAIDEMEGSEGQNTKTTVFVQPSIKAGKYKHFFKHVCELLHQQGWKVYSHVASSTYRFSPPGETLSKDSLQSDIKVREYLIEHHMMTPELKKAFDKYEQEVQKENDEMESSYYKNENRFVPSIDIKTGKYRRFVETGKYKRMADCNIFVLLDEQGWRFNFTKNPNGISYKPYFHPPPNENEKRKPPLTSDVKVKEYLKEHGMLTRELKKAFYEYDQEEEEESSLASVHDESSIIQSDDEQTIDNTSYTQEESTFHDDNNFTMPGLYPNEETLFLKASKILRKLGWYCNYKIHSRAVAGEMEFYPDPNQIYVYYRRVGEVIEALSKENSADNFELIEELEVVLKQYNEKKLAE